MDEIKISNINDFVFCPASIYFHNLYYEMNNGVYNSKIQENGTAVHKNIDNKESSSNMITSIDIYSFIYGLQGKIDQYDIKKKELIERKKKIVKIYDGYIYQLYAEYFCMKEMGYEIDKISLYSFDDNKKYEISMPNYDIPMLKKFIDTINDMRTVKIDTFVQKDIVKCKNCIYNNACWCTTYDE